MRTINLKQSSLNKEWAMQFVDESHYDTLYNESVKIYKPDGSPLLVLLKQAIDVDKAELAWSALKKFNSKTENRSTSSGICASPRKKKDGTISQTTRVPKGWEAVSGIVGYFERIVRQPYCHSCSWNMKHPEEFAKMLPMLKQTTGLFAEHVHDRYQVQKRYVDQTHKDFVIPETVYTTVTVNKNYRTACHLDAGDLASGFSNMIYLQDGLIGGGYLVLPNWRVAVQLGHLDLVMFDAHEWHGNTQVVPLTKGATRCTLVCYYREKMVHCKSATEELLICKNRKPGQPLFPESK